MDIVTQSLFTTTGLNAQKVLVKPGTNIRSISNQSRGFLPKSLPTFNQRHNTVVIMNSNNNNEQSREQKNIPGAQPLNVPIRN